MAPVGHDGADRVRRVVGERPVDLSGLSVLKAPTYRWHARQVEGRNLDLGSLDSIYEHWQPVLPAGYGGCVFVGSMRPDRQLHAGEQTAGASLLAADAMRSYVEAAPAEARAPIGSPPERTARPPRGAGTSAALAAGAKALP